MDDVAQKPTVTIKKYANRRLYNTATSSYVTLEHLSAMVKEGTEFNVYDAKTGEDITRSVLTQIIVEEEGKAGQNLLPISFLRQLIGFYGDNMQWLVPKYLEHSMQTLSKNQEQIRGYFQNTFGNMFPFGSTLEEMGKQNLAMFERAMRLFSPFTATAEAAKAEGSGLETPRMREGEMAPKPSAPQATSSQMSSPMMSPMAEKKPLNAAPPIAANAPMMASPQPLPRSVMPLPVGDDPSSDQDVQKKIAALQRQLADLAKTKA